MDLDLTHCQTTVLRISDEVSSMLRLAEISNYFGLVVSQVDGWRMDNASTECLLNNFAHATANITRLYPDFHLSEEAPHFYFFSSTSDQSSSSEALSHMFFELNILRNEREVISNEKENHRGDSFHWSNEAKILRRENVLQFNLIEDHMKKQTEDEIHRLKRKVNTLAERARLKRKRSDLVKSCNAQISDHVNDGLTTSEEELSVDAGSNDYSDGVVLLAFCDFLFLGSRLRDSDMFLYSWTNKGYQLWENSEPRRFIFWRDRYVMSLSHWLCRPRVEYASLAHQNLAYKVVLLQLAGDSQLIVTRLPELFVRNPVFQDSLIEISQITGVREEPAPPRDPQNFLERVMEDKEEEPLILLVNIRLLLWGVPLASLPPFQSIHLYGPLLLFPYEPEKSKMILEVMLPDMVRGPVELDVRAYNGSLPTLSLNPYAYTKVANMIFVDLPVGSGYSYATTKKANHSDDLQSGDHAYEFLLKWLVEHQEYLNNPFYVAGDSYSGITVPIVTQVISNGNDMGIKPRINLKGYILGNPVTFSGQDYYKIPFAHGMGLIPDELYKSLVTNCGGEYKHNGPTNSLCSRDMRTFDWLIKDIYQYHILESPCDLVSHESRRSLDENVQKLKNPATYAGVKCRTGINQGGQFGASSSAYRGGQIVPHLVDITKEEWHELSVIWANDKNVRDALHVRKEINGAWERCRSNLSFATIINSTIPYHANLSRKGFRSLIYSGDHDMVVPFISTQAWIKSLNYSIADDWKPWVVDGQVAGYTRSYANQMTFATVKGAGHTAPEWKPVECLAMLQRWLSHASL
ncbi:Carboxypeptidase [Datura stramonium]|uniref:Carboxypeptidase n=1 Tax=Datura stramonium TaxID=4076 RepID=A0ABS8RNJ1_DATST|nr:Carboxypeptidase [Datura stramonium]